MTDQGKRRAANPMHMCAAITFVCFQSSTFSYLSRVCNASELVRSCKDAPVAVLQFMRDAQHGGSNHSITSM